MEWKKHLGAFLIIASFYLVLQLLGITCPIKFILGISCPGCGMTRAWLAALRMDWAAAFGYHPLFWLVPLAVAGFFLRRKLPSALWKGMCVCALVAFCAVYLVRLLAFEDAVVVWAPREGLLFRVWQEVRAVIVNIVK